MSGEELWFAYPNTASNPIFKSTTETIKSFDFYYTIGLNRIIITTGRNVITYEFTYNSLDWSKNIATLDLEYDTECISFDKNDIKTMYVGDFHNKKIGIYNLQSTFWLIRNYVSFDSIDFGIKFSINSKYIFCSSMNMLYYFEIEEQQVLTCKNIINKENFNFVSLPGSSPIVALNEGNTILIYKENVNKFSLNLTTIPKMFKFDKLGFRFYLNTGSAILTYMLVNDFSGNITLNEEKSINGVFTNFEPMEVSSICCLDSDLHFNFFEKGLTWEKKSTLQNIVNSEGNSIELGKQGIYYTNGILITLTSENDNTLLYSIYKSKISNTDFFIKKQDLLSTDYYSKYKLNNEKDIIKYIYPDFKQSWLDKNRKLIYIIIVILAGVTILLSIGFDIFSILKIFKNSNELDQIKTDAYIRYRKNKQ